MSDGGEDGVGGVAAFEVAAAEVAVAFMCPITGSMAEPGEMLGSDAMWLKPCAHSCLQS